MSRGRLLAAALLMISSLPASSAAQSVRMRWYTSPVDGLDQPYAVVPPRGAEEGKALGLILGLHGHYGGPGAYCALILGGAKPPSDMVVACPYGYGDTAFRYIGEQDAFEVLKRVKGEFSIDPDRVYLTGASDGGIAAYELGLHYPDQWAGVVALAAWGGMTIFPSVGRTGHSPEETALVRLLSATSWAANGRHLPFFIANGAQDTWSPLPEETVGHQLQKRGYPVEVVLHPDLAHDTWTRSYAQGAAIDWLRRRRRKVDPNQISFRSADPRYNRAYWVEDLVLEAPMEHFGSVEASASVGQVEIKTAFLIGLALQPPPVTGAAGPRVLLDGVAFPARAGRRVFHKAEAGWREGPRPVPSKPSLEKVAGLAGPLHDLRSKAVVFVYGTGQHGKALEEMARAERDHWTRGIRVDYPVVADTGLTAAQREGRTLVLLGGHTMNSVTRSLGGLLPVGLSSKGRSVYVGKRRHRGKGVGYRVIYPSPWAPGQYVVVIGGTDLAGLRYALKLPELQPDYVVADARSDGSKRGMVLGKKRRILEAGFFDRRWRLKSSP